MNLPLRFLIIIPAYNEQDYIESCLQSLVNQTFQNFSCIISNDGSTDSTEQIAIHFLAKLDNPAFSIIHSTVSEHQPGAKVVQAFKRGLDNFNLDNFDIICKFDADIIFPKNYLEELNTLFLNTKKVGIASGLVYVNKNIEDKSLLFNFNNSKNDWKFENISSKNHVRGPIKAYRKICLEEMGGLRPVLGWDNLDVLLAIKYGWEVKTIKNLWVKHLRPTASHYSSSKNKKLGLYFYNIGLDFPLTLVSAGKSAIQQKSFFSFFTILKSFLGQKHPRNLTKEELLFIRKLKYKQILYKFFK